MLRNPVVGIFLCFLDRAIVNLKGQFRALRVFAGVYIHKEISLRRAVGVAFVNPVFDCVFSDVNVVIRKSIVCKFFIILILSQS